MSKRGKSYLDAREKVDRDHEYTPTEAVRIVKEFETAKFDETVEVHIRTGLNVRHADQQLRGTISKDQVRQIAEKKLPDLNAHDVDQAAKIIEGTARSMGVEVVA